MICFGMRCSFINVITIKEKYQFTFYYTSKCLQLFYLPKSKYILLIIYTAIALFAKLPVKQYIQSFFFK